MCIVTTKTMTQAQKGVRALAAARIRGEIVGLDKNLTKNGCAYGISFPCHYRETVVRILNEGGVSYGAVIGGGG